MEIMSGGELFDYVVEKGTLSEEEASGFIRQLTSAIAYMHKMGIIHRDLKPENLLLKSKSPDGVVKIIDFGLAKVCNYAIMQLCDAPMYSPSFNVVLHTVCT
jgi:serine/threonine protein kinase